MRIEKKDFIGKILLATKIISKDQLQEALRKQARSPGKLLGEILIDLGHATQEEVLMAYGLQHGIRYVKLDDVNVPQNIVDRISKKYACKYTILPFKEDESTFTIATYMPKYINKTIVEDLELLLDKKIELVLTGKDQIIAGICNYYNLTADEYKIFNTTVQEIPVPPTLTNDSDDDASAPAGGPNAIIKNSEKMSSLYESIMRVAKTSATIMILGETGTGKEMFAKAIWQNSLRKDKPFIKVSCAALPETLLESEMFGYEKGAFTGAYNRKIGRFELANHGTLFLDEIGEITIPVQIKLLRVLQESEFERLGGIHTIQTDVRIIAATNRNLEKEVDEGRFRKDLFYRLNVVSFTIPPLREHKEDVPYLIENFIRKFNKKHNKSVRYVSPKVSDILHDYDWPGNIRELENCVERMVVMASNKILVEHVPYHLKSLEMQYAYSGIDSTQDSKETGSPTANPQSRASHESMNLKDAGRAHILDALNRTKWNKVKAAKLLGIHRNTLLRKIKELGL